MHLPSLIYRLIFLSLTAEILPAEAASIASFFAHFTALDQTIHTSAHQLAVKSGQKVIFICEAEGSGRRPSISIRRDQPSSVPIPILETPIGQYGLRATGSKDMECRDTDYYRCDASDGSVSSVNQRLLVSVICPPQLEVGADINDKITYDGESAFLEIPVSGNPQPTSVDLFCFVDGGVQKKKVPKNKYKWLYRAIDLISGIIQITVQNENGNCQADIDNGLSATLTFAFELIKDKIDEDLSVGSIVGIVTGILGFLGTVLGCYFFWRR